MKGVFKNLIMIKVLMRHVEREDILVNILHLLVKFSTIDLYNAVNNFFVLPALNKNRIYKTIFWKTYQNFLKKYNASLLGNNILPEF